ncbi:MAG: hypothetical protein JO257_19070 [Deltaproteobacteria bacterium]|nr:hypothetical protein [Deltaproteobacteria bacterium]
MRDVDCGRHGRQGIGLVCTHVAHAIDNRQDVGFFWSDNTDTARPDAWCRACEQSLRSVRDAQGPEGETWFRAADFKILCAGCWDEAKRRLYGGD